VERDLAITFRAAVNPSMEAAGKTCNACGVPAPLQARVRHCAVLSVLRASPGRPFLVSRSPHVPNPCFARPVRWLRDPVFDYDLRRSRGGSQ